VQSDLDRFLALVRRELGAEDARVLDAEGDGNRTAEDPVELWCRMADGRGVAARFATPPADREAKQRRLEMLVGTFDGVVEEAGQRPKSRPPVVHSLLDELAALAARAAALNAIVIDANSPVVWGAAQPEDVIPFGPRSSSADGGRGPEKDVAQGPNIAVASRRALHAVRALPELPALRKGRHVRHLNGTTEAPFLAHSFAGIYILILVFDAPFDELRAERAVLDALPRIERLVLALPPLDPSPLAGVVAMRRPRRR
jgi:hypothetical protein